jgi:MFS family permease
MTSTAAVTSASAPADNGPRRALVVLCATEITSWGVLYYAFAVLSPRITNDTGWSQPAVAAAFSAGLITSAMVGIAVGRWLDRHGPRVIMTAGSVLAAASLVCVAVAPNFGCFVAAWIAVGVAMAAVLYLPAFAALTRWFGPRSVAALTVLTLVGGLASTVFAPVTAAFAAHLDWRATYLVLAGILAIVTVPAHLFGLRRTWPRTGSPHRVEPATRTARSRPFLALSIAFALCACASYAVIVNLVPLMAQRGIGIEAAAIALGLGGLGQVVGRLGYGRLVRHIGVVPWTALVLTGVAVTTALLGLVTTWAALVIVAILASVARGIMTLLQATAVTERWGPTHYGHLSGILSAPVTIMSALAPWIGAVLAGLLSGYAAMFLAWGLSPRWRR